MNVKLLKLTTNETLLAETTFQGGKYNLKKPAWIAQVKPGEFALVPWPPLAKDETITIDESKVVYCVAPETGIINEYSTGFGSGLVVPDGGVKPIGLKISGE